MKKFKSAAAEKSGSGDLKLSNTYSSIAKLASGMTEDEIIQDFPELTHNDIRACLQFAAEREKKLLILA